jgi:pimeloyl-ACP methyl ester carboxylesterase
VPTGSLAALQPQLSLLDERFPERLLQLSRGVQVAVRECGPRSTAPVLVLLHGISSGSPSWLHVAAMLGEPHRVVAWNAPGYGESTRLDSRAPTASEYATRLHQVLRALDIHRVVLVGHSLGALMACAYARLPDAIAVERLVLLSPARGYGGSPEQAVRVRRDRLDALNSRGVDGLAAGIDQRVLSPTATDAARAWVRWNTSRLHPEGYSQAVEMLCNSELGLVRGSLPIEVHCGDADVVTPPEACAQVARNLRAPFDLIASAGHASPVEQPGIVGALLRAPGSPAGRDFQDARR